MGKYLDSLGLSHLIGLIKTALSGKQATLVSGTNIKTINNESLLGSGNINVGGGSSLPSGGMQGAILAKASANDGDVTWAASVAPFKVYASSSNTVQTFCGFRELVAADIPSLTISKISNLQTTLDGKQDAGDYWEAVKDNAGYYGLRNPEGGTTGWVRTTSNGLIPAVSGGGSSSLGTSGWPFNNLYAQNIYHNGTKLGTAATHNHGDYALASHTHAMSNINGIGELAGMDTITEDGTSRTKNTVLAAPNGSNGAASFRSLVLADLPSAVQNKLNSIESGNAEIHINSLNGLRRLTLTTGNNLRVDTRASTSDEWTNGLYYPGIAPVSETTIANVVTQTSTQSTNNPITAAKYYKVNSVTMVEITFKPAAARSAGTAISLGTIVSGKRPHFQAAGGSDRITGSITSAGVCNLYARTALTANTAYTIGFTYTT